MGTDIQTAVETGDPIYCLCDHAFDDHHQQEPGRTVRLRRPCSKCPCWNFTRARHDPADHPPADNPGFDYFGDPMPRDQIATAGQTVAAISRWIDGSYPIDLDPEAHMWRRHQKVANEAGEVLDAIEGALGENPRKGVIGTFADVDFELLDTALAALAAHEFNHGNDGSSIRALFDHIVSRAERAGLPVPDVEGEIVQHAIRGARPPIPEPDPAPPGSRNPLANKDAVRVLGELEVSLGSHHPLTEHVRQFADQKPIPAPMTPVGEKAEIEKLVAFVRRERGYVQLANEIHQYTWRIRIDQHLLAMNKLQGLIQKWKEDPRHSGCAEELERLVAREIDFALGMGDD